MNKLFIFLLFCSGLILSGCDHSYHSYDYLMLHPAVLQAETMKCQLAVIQSDECKEVTRAGNDFADLVLSRQNNPEKFGEQLLSAEAQLAILKPGTDTYSAQSKQVQILKAVIAATSAE